MKLTIAKIDEKVFEGKFDSIILPGINGEIEIMPGHSPLLTPLKKGIINYKRSGESNKIEISKGFVEVNNSEVIVLL